MRNISYSIGGGLGIPDIEQLHRAALRVLEEVGVEIRSLELLDRLRGNPAVRVQGSRVVFDAGVVDTLVQQYRASRSDRPAPSDEFVLEILSGYALHLADVETGKLRPMLTEDCIRMAKLVNVLYADGVHGGTPGTPQDVPPALRQILAYKIGCQYSRTNGWVGFTTLREAEYLLRMAQLTGGSIGVSIFPLDPLVIDGPTVTLGLEVLKRGMPLTLDITSMPLRGVSTPFHLPTAFVESIATTLATFTVFNMLGAMLPFNISLFPFDLYRGMIAYGVPEHILYYLWSQQLNIYYGSGLSICTAFLTNAIFPDAHALMQRGAFAAVGALNGSRYYGWGGSLGVDTVFSPEMLMIDVEIMRYLKHLVCGVAFSPDTLDVDLIKEVGPGGSYMMHDSTLDQYSELWISDLFANRAIAGDGSQAQSDVLDAARRRVADALAGYDYTIDLAVEQELESIYRHASVEILG